MEERTDWGTLVDWKDMPMSELEGRDAVAVTLDGTVISGQLERRVTNTTDSRWESLSFRNLPQYVLLNFNDTGNRLATNLFRSLDVMGRK